MKKRKKREKKVQISLVTGYPVTTGWNTCSVIWYPNSKKSFVRTTLEHMKRWFK